MYIHNRIGLVYHVYTDLSMPSDSDVMAASTVHSCVEAMGPWKISRSDPQSSAVNENFVETLLLIVLDSKTSNQLFTEHNCKALTVTLLVLAYPGKI